MSEPARTPEAIGARLARLVFAKRGNHSEAHVSEAELAALLALAARVALGVSDGKWGKP